MGAAVPEPAAAARLKAGENTGRWLHRQTAPFASDTQDTPGPINV